MDRSLSDMSVFAAVVETGGFTAAGRTLGLSKSAVSKQVARLEQRLGSRLLQRTTRRLSLTEAGAVFYEGCQRVLAEAEAAESAVTHLAGAVRGVLRINAPMSFGITHLAPMVAAFMERFPELEVELALNDRTVDLVEEGYDVGVRIGKLADSSLVARRLAPIRRAVCASPDYLAKHGSPTRPEELQGHRCLIYSYLDSPRNWRFRPTDPDQGRARRVSVAGPLESNNGSVLAEAAAAGQGIICIPVFIVCDELSDGRLVEILPDWIEEHDLTLYAVYPERRHLAPKVRAFIDFLAERIGDTPPWEPVTR